MAVPSVTPASMALFQRIPERLFGPLASQNRHGYWALLCHLHRRRFGPDAPLPPSYGFLQRDVIQEIEDHLKYADEWQPESGDQPDTPLNIRAIGIFNRLVDAGWFRLERYGIEKTVNMAPAVGQLLRSDKWDQQYELRALLSPTADISTRQLETWLAELKKSGTLARLWTKYSVQHQAAP